VNKETKNNALYSINEMIGLIVLYPTRIKKGHFPLINKWTGKDGFTLDYVYFVVKSIYERFMKNGTSVTVGYLETSLLKMVDRFNPEVHKLPYCGSRDELLKSGHTPSSLPYCLLTKEERESKRQEVVSNVTDADRRDFKMFLESI
jgi:hypothetical protein